MTHRLYRLVYTVYVRTSFENSPCLNECIIRLGRTVALTKETFPEAGSDKTPIRIIRPFLVWWRGIIAGVMFDLFNTENFPKLFLCIDQAFHSSGTLCCIRPPLSAEYTDLTTKKKVFFIIFQPLSFARFHKSMWDSNFVFLGLWNINFPVNKIKRASTITENSLKNCLILIRCCRYNISTKIYSRARR